MTDYQIQLQSVFSAPSESVPSGVRLPNDWSLMWHQAETFKALQDPDIDVVINTAMTGDGKSLAAYLGMFCDRGVFGLEGAIGLYPTNELARDQERQIESYKRDFDNSDLRVARLSSETLELYAEQEDLKKGDAILSRAGNAEIILSNPDIFHYLHRGAYLIKQHENPDKLWNRLDKYFDLFIFDEFHVFQAPQISGVLNTMLLVHRTNNNKKFLFLSATPDDNFIEMLDRAGFRYRIIDPRSSEKYQFPATEADREQLLAQNHRCVVRAIDLNFIPLEPTAQASERWLVEQIEAIAQMFRDRPHSKGAIILNSIAAVKRLVPKFQAILDRYGLTVGENTGLSGRETKQRSLACDLVIGTSTIDIGVDFKINLLWFESADSGNFIQRLGRLGRHETNDSEEPFDGFTAFALAPKFLVERLFNYGDSPPLVNFASINRLKFHDIIRDSYRTINDFRGYYSRWGAIQSFKVWYSLGQPRIKSNYAEARDRFQQDVERVFQTSMKRAQSLTYCWAKEWQENFKKKVGNPIAEDACSFRGSSPLLCGIYDATEPNEADRFKTYDLPGILSNLDIEVWTETQFMHRLTEMSRKLDVPIAKGRFRRCLGFMQLTGYREERLNWQFCYAGDLSAVANAWRVMVLSGLEIWQPDNPWILEVNRRVRSQALVAYVLPLPVLEVRQRLQLPMHFAIYPIAYGGSVHSTTPPYSIAIGQAALLVDTLAARLKSRGDELWIA
ncbi:MAG: type I-D CRISPR-associated helicase Cas3' [Oscillatoriales cyanobacterium]|nr:MAG: type I-D CRISPR-associated helicase Cas3' [Oscillatoriales cyanobacterium]